jgi:uncharacterized protein (DUF2062 family)
MPRKVQSSRLSCRYWKERGKAFYLRIKSLQGDPRYVAVGMAVGVFVAFTPTIPFQKCRRASESCAEDLKKGIAR